MLGWGFKIQLLSDKFLSERNSSKSPVLAEWDTSMFGTAWIEALVIEGKADKVLSHGYPNSYVLRVSTLLQAIENGIPDHKGVTVIGDDYVMPGDWKGHVKVDLFTIRSLNLNNLVIVDAWDLS